MDDDTKQAKRSADALEEIVRLLGSMAFDMTRSVDVLTKIAEHLDNIDKDLINIHQEMPS